jgi:hypothetical protein
MPVGDDGVLLYGAAGLLLTEERHLLASLRYESFAPARRGADVVYSSLEQMEIDCDRSRERSLGLTEHARRNLEGKTIPYAAGPWRTFAAVATYRGLALREMCGQRPFLAEGLDLAQAMPTPPRSLTAAGLADWIVSNIDDKDYAFSTYYDDAAVFYSVAEAERTPQDSVRLWIRFERFRPLLTERGLMRSMRMLTEIDCKETRFRNLNSEEHPGSNLLGPAAEFKEDGEWTFSRPQTVMSAVIGEVCGLKAAADEEAADPARALPARQERQAL